jgi:CRP-like cAMP-binding protein
MEICIDNQCCACAPIPFLFLNFVFLPASLPLRVSLLWPSHRSYVKAFGSGFLFGEVSLFLGVPRTASAAAASPTTILLSLRKTDIDRFAVHYPNVAATFEAVAKRRATEHFRSFAIPFFTALPQHLFSKLIR